MMQTLKKLVCQFNNGNYKDSNIFLFLIYLCCDFVSIVLDENMIAAQAFVFFVAGFETSSNTIAFCLHELAVNPEIQQTVKQDILKAIANHGGTLNYEAIQEMIYLDAVVLGKIFFLFIQKVINRIQ